MSDTETKCLPDCWCGCDMETCACQDPKATIETDEDGFRYRVTPKGFFAAIRPEPGWEPRTWAGVSVEE